MTASVGPTPAGGCSGSPFQQSFFVVLKVFEGANPAVGCYRGPDLATFFFEGTALTASEVARSGSFGSQKDLPCGYVDSDL